PPEIAVEHAPEEGEVGAPIGVARSARAVAAPAPGREVVFGISLASQRSVRDWERTTGLLRSTLRSALGQTDPGVRVLVCGHERPTLAELADPRVEFLVSDRPPPADPQGFRRDKMQKRRIIALRLRQLGGGYLVPLDADDLVSNRLAAHVRSHDNRRGYSITEGYVLDWSNRRLAPVPGAWDTGFDRVCGSSAVLFLAPDDLPEENSPAAEPSYFELFGEHAYWPVVAEESGRKLEKIPFRGAVYVVNHAENLSFQLQRNRRRQENLIAAIAANSVPITRDIAAEFAISEEFLPAPAEA
ncbi:MAG TPA: glycosyltransferase family A protein, partial [Propylenella sp.]|nr:glycosyltransferase family A protein [Propylenella sp.]